MHDERAIDLLGLLDREPSCGYELKRDYDAYFGRESCAACGPRVGAGFLTSLGSWIRWTTPGCVVLLALVAGAAQS